MRLAKILPMFALAVLLLVGGCSSNNKGKIEGTKWSSQATTVKGQPLPAGILGLEFRADGSMVYQVGPQAYTGKYSLGGGDSVTLHLDKELANRKTHVQKVVINGENLTLIDSDGTQLTFNKTK